MLSNFKPNAGQFNNSIFTLIVDESTAIRDIIDIMKVV